MTVGKKEEERTKERKEGRRLKNPVPSHRLSALHLSSHLVGLLKFYS